MSRGKPFEAGHKKVGGRAKGTPNKVTLELEERARALNCDVWAVLINFVKGDAQALGYDLPRLQVMKDGGTVEVPWVTPDMRLMAAKEAAGYLYPKRKAVEHSGQVDADTDPKQVEALVEVFKEHLDGLKKASE